MPLPRFTKLELLIMESFWTRGLLAIREVQESFPGPKRPAYTTIQTTVYRLETKGALRRTKKISNAHMFEAAVSREQARGRIVDELLSLFGGHTQPVMAHLVETGKLTMDDVRSAEQLIRNKRKS